eukprot:gene17429-9032_t
MASLEILGDVYFKMFSQQAHRYQSQVKDQKSHRNSNMKRLESSGSAIFHMLVSAHGLYSFYWLRMVGGFRWTSMFYFTIWSLVAQILTSFLFFLSDMKDLFKEGDKKPIKDAKIKASVAAAESSHYKFILFHVSFVMSIATGIMFWVIYTIEPTALVPKEFFYPDLLNHMHHTFPWLLSIIQMFVYAKREINSFSLKMDVMQANEVGMVSMFIVGALYTMTSVASKFFRGFYPYPFMNSLTSIQYGIFSMFGMAFALMLSNLSNQVLFKIAKSMRTPKAIAKNR